MTSPVHVFKKHLCEILKFNWACKIKNCFGDVPNKIEFALSLQYRHQPESRTSNGSKWPTHNHYE